MTHTCIDYQAPQDMGCGCQMIEETSQHHDTAESDTDCEMSSRRSRSRQSGSSRITDEQISDLVSKLQDLLPEARLRGNDRVPSSRVLQETCSYIRSLHREVDDLSERLSELLATSDMSTAQAAVIRSLLM
nr:transcription factor ILI6 isoform X2 [Lolium perenne]XP_051183118.1 transcription factor ILI6 isoform X2 [Lolium perenne]